MHEHGHPDHPPTHHHVFDSPAMAAHAEAEAVVLLGLLEEATAVLAQRCEAEGVEVRRVLDLGCGPGVGTCELAARFGAASVVAVDGSATMLQRVTTRAEQHGLAARVETRRLELSAGFDDLGRADVVWASMVLHHVGDERSALRGIRRVLEPGGLLVVVEPAGPVRVVPADVDLVRPGIWDRIDLAWAAWFADMRADLPGATTSADHATMLGEVGFEVLADEVLTLVLDAPLDPGSRAFAHQQLDRTVVQLASHADPGDLEAIGALVEGGAIPDDATIRASRHLYVARR